AVALGIVDKKAAPVKFKQQEYPIPLYHPGDLRAQDETIVYVKSEKL
ncbi:MAG TPA: hydrogenase, partial [Nitrospiraceae bacterium]|nr:hydrogenase [Nitrospiraceae bacterium]